MPAGLGAAQGTGTDPMQTCRRRQPRFPVGPNTPATVEFRYPEGETGRVFRFAVVDVSASGLGFLLEADLPGLELGTAIPQVTFACGEHQMAMDLLVLHVTGGFAGDAVCGCLCYPASDGDLVIFKELLTELSLHAEQAGAGAGATS